MSGIHYNQDHFWARKGITATPKAEPIISSLLFFHDQLVLNTYLEQVSVIKRCRTLDRPSTIKLNDVTKSRQRKEELYGHDAYWGKDNCADMLALELLHLNEIDEDRLGLNIQVEIA